MEPLKKFDGLQKPRLSAELTLGMVMGAIWKFYAAAGILTLAYQVWLLTGQCSGVTACGIRAAKALVWTVLWPFYWVLHGNGIV